MSNTPDSAYLPGTTLTNDAISAPGATVGGWLPTIDVTVIPVATEIEVDVDVGYDQRILFWNATRSGNSAIDNTLALQTYEFTGESFDWVSGASDYSGGSWYATKPDGNRARTVLDEARFRVFDTTGSRLGGGVTGMVEVIGGADANLQTLFNGSYIGKTSALNPQIGKCAGRRTTAALCSKVKFFWVDSQSYFDGYYQTFQRVNTI